ncbi:uracil/xanthine transporter [Atlantibacter subterraneus]|uniref:uracil/xanthine transporter n=1 Tax=Atlantibacter subterraneus TaxID=255519 RepID=UPI002FDE56F8
MFNVLKLSRDNGLSGFQWLFFIFCNTVVVSPTLKSAFHLSDQSTFMLMQYAFISTALACLVQVIWGHKRAIMEGPTGLWWGTILSVTFAESSQGTSLADIGGSFAVGISLAGLLTVLVGISGLGQRFSRLFRPSVMVVFMFLLGAQLVTIFLKGMLGLPFGVVTGSISIKWLPFTLALAVVMLIIAIIVFTPRRIAKFAILIGTLIGWLFYKLWFVSPELLSTAAPWHWFPLGAPENIKPGIVITAVLTGLVNISNTFGAIRGTDVFYPAADEQVIYRRSFIVSGAMTIFTAPLGVVPFSPFVSSVGLITQTEDASRRSFILGSLFFLLIAVVPWLTQFFCAIPLTISSAVMLVAYLPLLWSALLFAKMAELSPRTIYRIAIPLFVGLFLMNIPPVFLYDIPLTLRPLLSNGLLMGILLAVLLENLLPWDRFK